MPITAIDTEKTVDQLIDEVYGRLSAAKLRAVKSVILAANSHLTETSILKPGMVLLLPPQQRATAESADIGASVDVVQAITAALSIYRKELANKIDTRSGELDESIKTLKAARFKKIIETIPAAEEFVRSIESSLTSQRSELDETQIFVGTELDKLNEELRKLQEE
jgi:hypothetical protein